jgi:hypothetical protein
MVNQQVRQLNPFVSRKKLHQVGFDLVRPFFFGEIQTPGQALDVRVNNDAFGLPKRHAQDDIGCFPGDTGEFEKLLHRIRNVSTVLFVNHARSGLETLRFVAEEAGRVDHGLEFGGIGIGEVLRRLVLLEERRRNGVDHFVGALCGQNRRDQQLEGIRMVEGALGVGIGRLEPLVDPFGPKILILFSRRTWRRCLSCRPFRCWFYRRCLPCCH